MEHEAKFPKTLQEAIKFFADPDTCVTFMAQLRWPEGVTCPHCQGKAVSYLSTRRMWKCMNRECHKQFSVKVGTIMEDSAIGLDKWLAAIWLIANAKNGISSYEIHRALGVTQKTGWFLLHRIRLAMQTGTFQKMSGTVEADETFIGGLSRNMHKHAREAKITGPGGCGKAIVFGLLKRHGEGSKVRTKVVFDRSGETLCGEIREQVERGAEVYTDAHRSYLPLSAE